MGPTAFWEAFAAHGARLYGGAPGFLAWHGDQAFAILTGEPNLDLNLCGLHGAATAADADGLVAAVDSVGCPAVVPTSRGVTPPAIARLEAAGFRRLNEEQAMWRPPLPLEPVPGPFDVRPARTVADLAAASRVIAEAHGTAPDLVERVFGLDEWRAGRIECWLAWDGDEAASVGWFTLGDGVVGVWELMTSPRHRRRGAARAVLTRGVAATLARAPGGAFLWASPMGAPLYRAVGFEVVEPVIPFVRGGTAEELALIGASPA